MLADMDFDFFGNYWVLELCADPCRPRTCADNVFFIYFLIDFEIRTLRGSFHARTYACTVDNQIIQNAILELGKNNEF